ncbi:MAG: DNA topoisomerase (ATP-hydrolyzing) subunit B [Chloroflexi bacterium]|nr:DNA topoisomerase (ATP-hydrolyzing) subunit B [Chloroflexota bacterium]
MAARKTQVKKKPAKTSDYTASDIQVLEGLEAVRRRPGMYIGSTDQRGLHQLVFELLDNAIDEAMAGFCDHIWINIREDGRVLCRDNGRGIPIGKHPKTGKSALETVMTYLHAGGKFGGGAYKVSGGLHGVGASLVNALSSETWVEVHQKGKIYRQEYSRGHATTKVQQVKQSKYPFKNGSIKSGTITSFLPDHEIFETLDYDFHTIVQRLREAAYLTKGVWIQFVDERIDREMNFFFEGGVSSFVRHLNQDREVLHPRPIYIDREVEGVSVEAAIQYNDGFSEAMYAFANCINTIDGGSHLTGFRSALTRVLNDYGRKSKLLKDGDANLSGEDTREGLVAVVSVKLGEPQFEGQTKTRLGNPEVKGIVESVIAEELSAYLEEHPSEGRKIIEKCVITSRAREAARKAKDLVVRKGLLDGSNLPGKLADCSDREPENCELYIVEGPSAGGSAKQGRDRRFQAILPLRGKILNIEKARLEKMLSHEELRVLISAMGCGFGENLDLEKLRYHRVIIMTDADVDGAHIRTLLLTFFFRYYKELIDAGYLYIAQPPLYRVQSGKTANWLFSDADLQKYQKSKNGKKFTLQRYKGLGEMNADQLWDTTMDPATRTLLRVDIENAMEADLIFSQLMGEEVAPRKKFIQAHAAEATIDA